MLQRAFPRLRPAYQRHLLWVLVLVTLSAGPCYGQLSATNFKRTQLPGFGDRQNSYSWSMRWFKGNLYVGTNRNFNCVEKATIAFYFPILKPVFSIYPDPDVPCPDDPADMDLRAEVWRFTPETAQWTRVFRSEVVPNPQAPGKFVARDIGYRDMAVFTDPDGTESLYLVGCSAREYTPGLPPPRILRMRLVNPPGKAKPTEVFTPIPQDPGTVMGDLNAITFRATAVYKNRFYVTASPGLTGDGYLLESANPALGNNSFRVVTDPALHIYELCTFNNSLYIGAGDQDLGYSVWKTNATGPLPYALTPIVTNGAGRGKVMTSVVSMFEFKQRLYVGSAGWYSTLLPSSELIRINPDDSWDLISGNPRPTPNGILTPLSGLSDGFGNPFNAHIWRMQDHDGFLYAGTNDSSLAFRHTPLDPVIRAQYGFDLFASKDGVFWTPISRNGLGNPFNFGQRTFASTPFGLFVGTVNYTQGTEVLLGHKSFNAAAVRGAMDVVGLAPVPVDVAPDVAPPPSPPARVESERRKDASVLSWEPAPDAASYEVFRAEVRSPDIASYIGLDRRPEFHEANQESPGSVPRTAAIAGRYVSVGTTDRPYFLDRDAGQGGGRSYSYYVQAVDDGGKVSSISNLTTVPNLARPVTFKSVRAELAAVAAGGKAAKAESKQLLELLDRGRARLAAADAAGSERQLDALGRRLADDEIDALDAQARESLGLSVTRLKKRVGLVGSGVLKAAEVDR